MQIYRILKNTFWDLILNHNFQENYFKKIPYASCKKFMTSYAGRRKAKTKKAISSAF